MNLHEECLLKYLSNPQSILNTTEILKFNNGLIEKAIASGRLIAKSGKIGYTTNRM